MGIEEKLKLIDAYTAEDLNFSALELWNSMDKESLPDAALIQYADTLRSCGHYMMAIATLDQLENNEMVPEVRYVYLLSRANLLMDMHQTEKAIKSLKECIESDNCDTAPFIYLAVLLMSKAQTEEAIYYLETALEKPGDTDEVCFNLACNYAIKGDFEEALYFINRCLDLDPDFPNAYLIKKDISIVLDR